MAFNFYEVIHVACQSHSWFVLYALGEKGRIKIKQTKRLRSDVNNFLKAKSRAQEKPILAG